MKATMRRRFIAECLGTCFLLMTVVGSGIMGDRLSQGNVGLALLANSIATGAGLIVFILIFGGISGAHFNPLVSIAELLHKRLCPFGLAVYMSGQLLGAILGVIAAHIMFGEQYWGETQHLRTGWSTWFSEFVATFGLIATIRGVDKHRTQWLPVAIGCYIAAAYWFTASTSFANPVVTLARSLTHTFAGIRLIDVPAFCLAQLLGAVCAEFVFSWLLKDQA